MKLSETLEYRNAMSNLETKNNRQQTIFALKFSTHFYLSKFSDGIYGIQ